MKKLTLILALNALSPLMHGQSETNCRCLHVVIADAAKSTATAIKEPIARMWHEQKNRAYAQANEKFKDSLEEACRKDAQVRKEYQSRVTSLEAYLADIMLQTAQHGIYDPKRIRFEEHQNKVKQQIDEEARTIMFVETLESFSKLNEFGQ